MDEKIKKELDLPAVRLGIGYAAGCLAGAFSDDVLRAILLAGAAMLAASCFIMRREKLRAAALFMGLLSMSAYMWGYCQPLKAHSGEEMRASCRVMSVEYSAANYTISHALTVVGGFPALIELTGNYAALPGDIIDADITLTTADANMFTFSDGVVLEGGVEEVHGTERSFSLLRIADAVRTAAAERLDVVGGDEAELCKGLLLGNKSGFSLRLKRDITYSGVNYMTAVSGAHITLVLMILMELFGRGKYSQAIIALVTVPVLAVLFGFSPSVMRAGIMMLFAKTAPMFLRRADIMNSLCSAVLALTLFSPYAATDPALQMSALGVFGAAVLGRRMNQLRRFEFERFKLLAKIKEAAVISLCAMICIAPVSVSCFGGISLVELSASVALAPFFTAAVTLGLVVVVTGLPILAVPLIWVMKGFRWILGVFGGASWAWLPADGAVFVPLAFLSAALLVVGVFHAEWSKPALQSFALALVLFVCAGSFGVNTRRRIDLVTDGRSGAAIICTRNEASVVVTGSGSGLRSKLFNEFLRCGITRVTLVNAPQLSSNGMAVLEELSELFPMDEIRSPESDMPAADVISVDGSTIACAKAGDISVSADIVLYYGNTDGVPESSAALPVYISAWQQELPAGGVNIYNEPLRIKL